LKNLVLNIPFDYPGATFKKSFSRLRLNTEDGQTLVGKLNSAFQVKDYGALGTPEKFLHIIVEPKGESFLYRTQILLTIFAYFSSNYLMDIVYRRIRRIVSGL
jgi:hypothetical protein